MKLRAGGLLGTLAALLGWLLVAPVQLGGGAAYLTTHGNSMEPRFHVGDLAVVRPSAHYGVGDVVAYSSDALDTVVMHRIVAVEGNRYVFRGDNNSWLDPDKPTAGQLVGKLAVRVPQGGVWLDRLTSPPALAAASFLLVLGGGATAVTRRQRRKDRRTMSPRHHAVASRSLGGLPPSLRPVAAGAAALALAGAALSGLAWTRPTTSVVPSDATVQTTLDFSYTATVPRSAAYDGTTVTAPQPVFRRLAEAVDVGFHYAGQPGDVTVYAELSSSSGWRSTVRLTGPARISGDTWDATVRLDLPALAARAAAGADVIGLPAGALEVAVVPRIALDQGGEFAPRLTLSLDELSLRPSGDAELKAEQSTPVAGTRPAAATLSALGHHLSVSTARTLGVAAVALALLAAAVLAAVARWTGPVAESDRIRRRYGDLVLTVMPVVLAAGRPVVDVPDVASLVKLAERYGLLVLTWSRGGVDTYVVQDEGTTYRYRTGVATQPLPVPAG